MPNRSFHSNNRLVTLMPWTTIALRYVLSSLCLLIICLMHQGVVFAQAVDTLRQGVVKLVATADGKQKTGTGFVIRQDAQTTYILTARHVVAGDKYPKVAFFSQPYSLIEAEVLQNDVRSDISLLKLRNNTQVPVDVATLRLSAETDVKDNEELIAIGFPAGGGPWTVVRVTLAGRHGIDLIFDGNIDGGNSGSPILRKNGEIVGLVTNTDKFARAIPAEMITMVLEGWEISLAESRQDEVIKQLSVEPEMVRIPAGTFVMGSPETEKGRKSYEGPQRKVTIASFEMSRFEITVGQFRQFIRDTHYRAEAEQKGIGCFFNYWYDGEEMKKLPERNWQNPGFDQTDKHPVVCITWNDAQAYVQWLSQQTGKDYRLPTEAEWEYAARAGTRSARSYPDDKQCDYANGLGQEDPSIKYKDIYDIYAICSDSYVNTAPVGQFKHNPFGLFDMLGNVWEWTQDCWHSNYINAPTDGSAWLKADGGNCDRRVVRGGSWLKFRLNLRSAIRDSYNAGSADFDIGFRIARDF